jgi:aryl-alcohol dehydrogenase-like predicted oxidoreductase
MEVSRIALGAMTFGSRMPPISTVDVAAAEAMLERAVDAGVNLIDTADAYSGGESEEMLAHFLRRYEGRVLLATKVGFGGDRTRPLSRENVIASAESSLRRLGTDRIDILYLHRPDRSTPMDETLDAVEGLVSRGLVRTFGVSNWTAGETGYAVGRQRALNAADLTSVQVYWSLVGREVEHEIVPTCARLDVGIIVWSPLAAGYLAERTDGRRSKLVFPPVDDDVGQKVLRVVRDIAERVDATPAQVAIAWLLHRQEVSSVLVGASTMTQLEQNLAAADLALDQCQIDALSDASAIPLTDPRWWDAAMGL